MTPDEITREAFERLHSWNDNRAELFMTFTFDVALNSFFQIIITVLSIHDDHSSITLQWLRRGIDPTDNFIFAETQGRWGIFLAGATFEVSNNPKPSVTILRGPFKVKLDEIRGSAL